MVTHEGRPDPWGGGGREHGDFRDENQPEVNWMETTPESGKIDTHPLNITKKSGNYYWGNGLGTLDPNFDDGPEKINIDELEDNTYFVLPFGLGGLHSYLGIDGDDAPKQWGSIFDFMSSRLLGLIANKNGYLFNENKLKKKINNHLSGEENNGFILWKALNLAVWYNNYMK